MGVNALPGIKHVLARCGGSEGNGYEKLSFCYVLCDLVEMHRRFLRTTYLLHGAESFLRSELVLQLSVHKILVCKPVGKRPLGRPKRRWEDNIKMDLQEVGRGGGDWMGLAQDRDRWQALVRTVMNFRVP